MYFFPSMRTELNNIAESTGKCPMSSYQRKTQEDKTKKYWRACIKDGDILSVECKQTDSANGGFNLI